MMHFMKFVSKQATVLEVRKPFIACRFASHRSFRCWCLDTSVRRQANENLRILFREIRNQG